MTGRWTDARRTNGNIMLLSHTLTMRESDVASFVEFRSAQWFRRRKRDEQKDGRRTHGKVMWLSHTLTMRGSGVVNLVKFKPVVYEEIA